VAACNRTSASGFWRAGRHGFAHGADLAHRTDIANLAKRADLANPSRSTSRSGARWRGATPVTKVLFEAVA